MAGMFDCEICFDTKNVTEQVICPFCQLKICQECIQKWLLMEKVAYSCPNCKKGWNFSFIYNSLPLKFINNSLKPNYAEICKVIDRQQYLQPYIDKVNFCKNINNVYRILIEHKINYNEYNYNFNNYYNYHYNRYTSEIPANKLQKIIEIYPLVTDYIIFDLFVKIFNNYNSKSLYSIYLLYNYINKSTNDILNNNYIFGYDTIQIDRSYDMEYIKEYNNTSEGIKELFNILDSKYTPYKCIDIILYIIKHKIGEQAAQNINKIKKQERRKICKCDKNCNGDLYKYKTQLICDVCKCIFCAKCRKEIFPEKIERFDEDKVIEEVNPKYKSYTEEQKQQHKCQQEDIDMVKYLNENIKNCPKCEEPIEKNGGCDHMWCPKCHTMFNWSDLKITKTTTNPLYFQWLREQGLTPTRLNHPDAQPFNICAQQLSYSNCINIVKKYIPSEYQFKFLNFAHLMELKIKPNNEPKIDVNRKKYAFGLITEKQYTKYISTLYISKFFIDNYNAIISNTMFMISELFKVINDNKTNLNMDNYINSMYEILKIHNEALTNFNKLYPNFNIQIVDENIVPITIKDDKIVKSKRKINLTIKYDDTINYFDSPIKLIYGNKINKYSEIYLYFLTFYFNIKLSTLYDIHKTVYSFFPDYDILNNKVLYDILTDEEIIKQIISGYREYSTTYYNKISKQIEKKYKIKKQFGVYTSNLSDILEYINVYYYNKKLDDYLTIFKQNYNTLLETLKDYKVNYTDIIYNQKHDKTSFNVYINRSRLLQTNLHKLYKYNKAELINNLQKNNINISLFVNETIFNKSIDIYCLILTMEKDLMNSIKDLINPIVEKK